MRPLARLISESRALLHEDTLPPDLVKTAIKQLDGIVKRYRKYVGPDLDKPRPGYIGPYFSSAFGMLEVAKPGDVSGLGVGLKIGSTFAQPNYPNNTPAEREHARKIVGELKAEAKAALKTLATEAGVSFPLVHRYGSAYTVFGLAA